MGQQQILLLILGVCVLGITVSVGVITVQQDASYENRALLISELRHLGARAQEFYRRPIEDGGGNQSFLPLTIVPRDISVLSAIPSKVHGDFYIVRSNSCTSMQIIANGVVPGIYPRFPVRVMLTVYPDSSSISILN